MRSGQEDKHKESAHDVLKGHGQQLQALPKRVQSEDMALHQRKVAEALPQSLLMMSTEVAQVLPGCSENM